MTDLKVLKGEREGGSLEAPHLIAQNDLFAVYGVGDEATGVTIKDSERVYDAELIKTQESGVGVLLRLNAPEANGKYRSVYYAVNLQTGEIREFTDFTSRNHPRTRDIIDRVKWYVIFGLAVAGVGTLVGSKLYLDHVVDSGGAGSQENKADPDEIRAEMNRSAAEFKEIILETNSSSSDIEPVVK